MKIGFSFGRCVRDIVKGEVDIDSVVVIVAATHVERDTIASVIHEYSYHSDYLGGLDKDKCLEVAYQLWDQGKIHQPRQWVGYRSAAPASCVWMDLFPTAIVVDENIQEAWDNYQVMLGITNGEKVADAAQDAKHIGS